MNRIKRDEFINSILVDNFQTIIKNPDPDFLAAERAMIIYKESNGRISHGLLSICKYHGKIIRIDIKY